MFLFIFLPVTACWHLGSFFTQFDSLHLVQDFQFPPKSKTIYIIFSLPINFEQIKKDQ